MADKPTPPGPIRPVSPGPGQPKQDKAGRAEVDRALLLKDVVDHAVRVHKETTGPFGRSRRIDTGKIVAAACLPVLALCVYSFVAKPEFIWGPRPGPLPAARQEANVRFAMFMLAQRILAYREARGSFPESLTALADSVPGVSYQANETTFELRATENGKAIVFRSDQSADAFLGNTISVIQGGAP